MTALTPASSPDVACASSRAATLLTEPASLGHVTALLRELTASWHPPSTVAERRREHRLPCDLPAVLVPLDDDGKSLAGVPLDVRMKDISQHGLRIAHPEPMPHRLVLLAFETAESGTTRVMVRLKWCRFKRTDVYESGGAIVRVLKPGEELKGLLGGVSE